MNKKEAKEGYYSWVVLAACTLMQLLADGIVKSFGLFNVEILEEFKKSVSMTTLIMGVFNGVFCIASVPLMTYLIKVLQPRTVIIIGSIMTTLGYSLSSLAPNIYFLFFSLSLLAGAGTVAALPPGLVVLSSYFSKRRATANGIALAGCCLGGLICPPLYRYLLDTYGLRGALLLTGGVLLHNLPMACLLKSPDSQSHKEEEDVEVSPQCDDEDKPTFALINKDRSMISSESRIDKHRVINGCSLTPDGNKSNKHEFENETMIKQNGHLRTKSDMFLFQRSETKYHGQSLPVLFRYPSSNLVVTDSVKEVNENNIKSSVERKSLKSYLICELLTNPTFLLFAVAISIANTISTTFLSYLPLYGKEHNIDKDKIVILVSLTGACDFVGRIFCGLLADMHKVKTPYIIAVSQAICGIVYNCNQLMTTFPGFVCFAVVIGLFSGMYLPLMHTMTVETFGLSLYPSAVSILIVSQFPVFIVGPLVFGLLRDSTGSYVSSFHVIGAVGLVSALLLVCVPILERCSKPHKLENNDTNID